jgi:hypothetical protein
MSGRISKVPGLEEESSNPGESLPVEVQALEPNLE